MTFLAPLDARTLLYVARAEDEAGPWLGSRRGGQDHTSRECRPRPVHVVAASRDGRRLVATIVNPTASLWTVPILDRLAEDRDVRPYRVPTMRALAPRFGGTSGLAVVTSCASPSETHQKADYDMVGRRIEASAARSSRAVDCHGSRAGLR